MANIKNIHYRVYELPGEIDTRKPLSTDNIEYVNDIHIELYGFKSNAGQFVRVVLHPGNGTYLDLKLPLNTLADIAHTIKTQTALDTRVDATVKQETTTGHTRQDGPAHLVFKPIHNDASDRTGIILYIFDDKNNTVGDIHMPPTQTQDFQNLTTHMVDNSNTTITGTDSVLTPVKLDSTGERSEL